MAIPLNQVTVAQLILKGTLAGAGSNSRNIQSIFTYRRIATAVAPTKIALSNAFLAGPYAAMLAAFNAGWTLGNTNIRWLNDALDATIVTTLAGVGAIATDRSPSFSAVYFYMKTGVRGRSYNGSKHLAGVNEIDTTGDILTGAGLARWQTVQTALLAPLTDATGNTWNPAIVSYSLSQLRVNPTTVVVNDVVQVILDINLGTMKRRKVKTVI